MPQTVALLFIRRAVQIEGCTPEDTRTQVIGCGPMDNECSASTMSAYRVNGFPDDIDYL